MLMHLIWALDRRYHKSIDFNYQQLYCPRWYYYYAHRMCHRAHCLCVKPIHFNKIHNKVHIMWLIIIRSSWLLVWPLVSDLSGFLEFGCLKSYNMAVLSSTERQIQLEWVDSIKKKWRFRQKCPGEVKCFLTYTFFSAQLPKTPFFAKRYCKHPK